MKKQELTEIQKKILEILKSYIAKHSIPPTIKEISTLCGLSSTSSVHHQLSCLEEKGYIVRDKTKSRSIKLTGKRISSKKTSTKDVKKKDTKKKNNFETTKLNEISIDENIYIPQPVDKSFDIPVIESPVLNNEDIDKIEEKSSTYLTEESSEVLSEVDSAPTVEDLAEYAGDFDFDNLYKDYLENSDVEEEDESEPLESMIEVGLPKGAKFEDIVKKDEPKPIELILSNKTVVEEEQIEEGFTSEPVVEEVVPVVEEEQIEEQITPEPVVEEVAENLEVSMQEEPKLCEYTFAGFDKDLSPISRDVFYMPSEFTGISDAMLYEVNTDELENFGIYNGDIILIEYNSDPKNDDIVFAVYDGQILIKQVKFLSHVAILSSGNKNNNISADRSNIVFIGVVKGLFRTAFIEDNKTEENKQYPLIKYVNKSIEIASYYKLPPRLLGVSEAFLFVFDNNDMEHFNVLNGDFGIFEYIDKPNDGDLALLLVDDKMILRIVNVKDNENYLLVSGSSSISDIEIKQDNLVCFGRFKGLFRKF